MAGGSHFYTADGTCISGLREARKVQPQPLPSPTTVLSLLKSEGLIQYFKRQMFEAAVTTPRLPHWSDDEFYEACVKWSEEHSLAARDKGTSLHDEIQNFHKTGWHDPDNDQMVAYAGWYRRYVKSSLAVEQFVVGDGYAGRMDHRVLLRDGREAVMDTKTQALKKRRSFNVYPEWGMQMGAYALACPPGVNWAPADVLISVVISSDADKPVVLEAHYWPNYPHYYCTLFKGLLAIWREFHEYPA